MNENTNVEIKISNSNSGSVCFAPDVLVTIAGLAIAEVEGVANTTGFSALLAEKISKKQTNNLRNITRGIKAEVFDDNQVSITATVVVEYGRSVPEVAKTVQENIKKTVETMTGMNVKNVDVKVSGLSFSKENKEAAELEFQRYMLDEQSGVQEVEPPKAEDSNTENN